MQKPDNFKSIYTGIYPDGSKITTQLDTSNGMVLLRIRGNNAPHVMEFCLGQQQAVEVAYGLLKGVNKYIQHLDQNNGISPMKIDP